VLRIAAVLLLIMLGSAAGAGAARQDSLGSARDLYTTADYREALAMLTRLRTTATLPAELRTIDQYRAFALIALGRSNEAEQVIEAIALADPSWTLPAGEAPPRIATLFAQARERALPGVLRQRLAAARALYAEKRFDLAAEAFTSILLLLDDPEIVKAAGSDAPSVTALATGFRDLSLAADEQARAAAARATPPAPADTGTLAAATPPTPGAGPGGVTEPVGGASTPAESPAAAPEAPVQGATDIVPPTAISQPMPRATDLMVPMGGAQTILLDLVIDETGRVERAEIRRSVNRLYEAQLVAATRNWRYTPATQGGRPVKYSRTVEVTLTPREQ
jgi:TonB family protein